MARQFSTVIEFIQYGKVNSNTFGNGIIEFEGFNFIGDGGASTWQRTGVINLTPSQTPTGLDDNKFTDSAGDQWELLQSQIVTFNGVQFLPPPFGEAGHGGYYFNGTDFVFLANAADEAAAAAAAAQRAEDAASDIGRQLTTSQLISSNLTYIEVGDTIETNGFSSGGDGGGAQWLLTSEIGTPSQSPAEMGSAKFTDSNGRAWSLVYNYRVKLEALGFTNLTPELRTNLVQGVIESLSTLPFGGEVFSPDGFYEFGTTAVVEQWDNAEGGFIQSTNCCIVKRPNVSISGSGMYSTTWYSSNPANTIMFDSNPENATIKDITFRGSYSDGSGGAGHGYFQVVSDLNHVVKNVTIENFRVLYVASYGLGLNYGTHQNVRLKNIQTFYTGSDGIDIKSRAANFDIGYSNTIRDVYASQFGTRLTGAVGVDVRGEWNVSGVWADDFGVEGRPLYGLRTRPVDNEPNVSKRTIVSDVHVYGGGFVDNGGIFISGDSTVLMGFEIDGCGTSISVQESYATQISGGVISNSLTYSIRSTVSGESINISNVRSKNSPDATAHFRLEGEGAVISNVTGDNSTAEWSLSAAAANSISRVGSDNSASDGVDVWSPVAGRTRIQAKGVSDNIDIEVTPKGTGLLRYGSHASVSSETVTGYVTIRDSSGAFRKLAVIS